MPAEPTAEGRGPGAGDAAEEVRLDADTIDPSGAEGGGPGSIDLHERWTFRSVLELAPDGRAAQAARRVAGSPIWSDLGSTETLVWGKCQGSGRTPYQVTVDLLGPAFSCTCPSRKQPCKHGVALMLVWVEGRGGVAHRDKPVDWATHSTQRPTKTETIATTSPAPPPEPQAQAERERKRIATMSAGIDDFAAWLADLIRHGLADARRRPYSFWDTAAARLVDAQLPGLAQRVRDMAGLMLQPRDWADAAVAEVGRWFLIVRAWRNRENLSADQMGDLRTAIGWHRRTAEVRAGQTVHDEWVVVGIRHEDDGTLQSLRTWLHGRATGELVMVLDFAAAGMALRTPQALGSVIAAPVALYPGSPPRRALFCEEPIIVGRAHGLPIGGTIAEALETAAGQLAQAPLRTRFPVGLRSVVPAPDPAGTRLVDGDRHALTVAGEFDPWVLLAVSAGHPVDVFGELADRRFVPVAAVSEGELVSL